MSKYFGTDGFRGKANIVLTADHAYRIGRFLGYHYQSLPCVKGLEPERCLWQMQRGRRVCRGRWATQPHRRQGAHRAPQTETEGLSLHPNRCHCEEHRRCDVAIRFSLLKAKIFCRLRNSFNSCKKTYCKIENHTL